MPVQHGSNELCFPVSATETARVSSTATFRQRCYVCFRPQESCFCDQIPSIENQTDVLLVQHPRERRHAFNTARIVHQALSISQLVSGYPHELAKQQLPLRPGAALLYPSESATLLSELAASERPQQLVVVDGTWHHAKTMVRDVPWLRALPRVRLAPALPGRFRIRREPNAHALSTVEAVVATLRELEPETLGLQDLLTAFDTMVERQLAHPRTDSHWRHNTKRRNDGGNLPKVFREGLQNIVVAYGESESQETAAGTVRVPIYWVAEHLGTGQRFACRMKPSRPLRAELLRHLQLDATDFQHGCSRVEFRSAWNQFCRPGDTTVVYNKRTIDLLLSIDAVIGKYVVLKSIRLDAEPGSRAVRNLDELLDAIDVQPQGARHAGRAGQRLANAIAFVRHLSTVA